MLNHRYELNQCATPSMKMSCYQCLVYRYSIKCCISFLSTVYLWDIEPLMSVTYSLVVCIMLVFWKDYVEAIMKIYFFDFFLSLCNPGCYCREQASHIYISIPCEEIGLRIIWEMKYILSQGFFYGLVLLEFSLWEKKSRAISQGHGKKVTDLSMHLCTHVQLGMDEG